MVMRILNWLKLSSDSSQWCQGMIPACTDGTRTTQLTCEQGLPGAGSFTYCKWHSTGASMSANGVGGTGFCNAWDPYSQKVMTVQACEDQGTWGMFIIAVVPQMTGQLRAQNLALELLMQSLLSLSQRNGPDQRRLMR